MRRAPIALLVVALTAACGNGGGQRLSREEYAKRADAVCRRYDERTRRLGTPRSMRALGRVANRGLPLLDTALRDLRRLRPPADEQGLASRWLRELRLLRGDVVRIRDRARANDAAGVRGVVPRAARRNGRFAELATQLGMQDCNRN